MPDHRFRYSSRELQQGLVLPVIHSHSAVARNCTVEAFRLRLAWQVSLIGMAMNLRTIFARPMMVDTN
jgi:hypothetical protein